jgi:hypothetical protein
MRTTKVFLLFLLFYYVANYYSRKRCSRLFLSLPLLSLSLQTTITTQQHGDGDVNVATATTTTATATTTTTTATTMTTTTTMTATTTTTMTATTTTTTTMTATTTTTTTTTMTGQCRSRRGSSELGPGLFRFYLFSLFLLLTGCQSPPTTTLARQPSHAAPTVTTNHPLGQREDGVRAGTRMGRGWGDNDDVVIVDGNII